MASTYLTRTESNGERKKFTFSAWIKRNSSGSNYPRIFSSYIGGTDYLRFNFNRATDGEQLQLYIETSGAAPTLLTNRLFRDPSAWYHLVVAVDTTLGTADDRMKLYVNGSQETSFATRTNPSQDQDFPINSSSATMYIGRQASSSASFFDGCMSHVHFCDGTALAPTVFGETDSTTGEWKIKPSPSFTLGTNGFTILKDGNTITDQSTNSNDFTLGGGTLTATKDCPDNNFARLNDIDKNDVVVLTNGSTTSYSTNNGTWSAAVRSTLGIASGKFYWEMKITGSGTANGLFFGVCSETVRLITNQGIQDSSTEKAKGVLVFCDDGQYQLDTNSRTSMTSAPAFNDILGCAVDRDNNTVKFYKNGSEVGSIDISSSPLATCSHIMPLMINFYTNTKFNFNFGNGLFGTTAITTNTGNGYAGAEGKSKFNYQPPTGYSALSTRGLNE